MRTRVAIVGSGISGLAAAHALGEHVDVSLFEAGDYFGGHTHTVDVRLPNAEGVLVHHGVDTGFLVFNERTYPNFIALLEDLDIPSARSDMSFSVQVPRALGQRTLEWNGATLNTVFAQRSNLMRPRFLRMLREILRFNTLCTDLAEAQRDSELAQPLEDFLKQHQFSETFKNWYLLPMLACIWSCPTDQMLKFPVATLVRFCHNHGLIQVNDRPQWHTVAGGARHYVEKIVARIPDKRLSTPVERIERDGRGVHVFTRQGAERFDHVILATHSDQSLKMLAQPTTAEQQILGAVRYQSNLAVLHTDERVMPQKKLAWAAWNYERAGPEEDAQRVCLHYWLNRLQPLPFAQPVLVSLNPIREIEPQKVLGRYDYAHPVFDLAAMQAQTRMPDIQGRQATWYAGAWMGYGFHEDGLKAGRAAAQALLASLNVREAQAA